MAVSMNWGPLAGVLTIRTPIFSSPTWLQHGSLDCGSFSSPTWLQHGSLDCGSDCKADPFRNIPHHLGQLPDVVLLLAGGGDGLLQ